MSDSPPVGTPCLRPIRDFLQSGFPEFRVEKYQRGFKWQKEEVRALLEDVSSFTPSADEAFYCLQPIVVCRHGEPVQQWELIDGQQRLTTIYILLCFLRNELDTRPYRLSYRTRPESTKFIEQMAEWPGEAQPRWRELLESTAMDDNVDNFHFHQAWQTVAHWFAEHPKSLNRTTFLEKLLACRVIWYEPDTAGEEARETFMRLNSGKIALTDAELVKALFLRSRTESDHATPWQTEMAREWDAMEYALQDNAFWFLINKQAELKQATRIGFVFEILCSKPEDSNERYFCYHKYVGRFAEAEAGVEAARAEAWREVKACFLTLREWLEDSELHHLVGYIITRTIGKVTVTDLHARAQELSKSAFRRWLTALIQKHFDDVVLEDLTYADPSHRRTLMDVLLLFNLIPLMKSGAHSRFRFDLFNIDRWSLEHIHAQKAPSMKREEWEEWYGEQMTLLNREGSQEASKLRQMLQAWERSPAGPAREKERGAVEDQLSMFFKDVEKGLDIDGLGNLALLGRGDNSALGNRPFQAKRRSILERDRAGAFIPVETRNVFLKSYSSQVTSMMAWTREDRREYLETIRDQLAPYFQDSAPPPEMPAIRVRRHAAPAELSAPAVPVPRPRPGETRAMRRATFWQILEEWRLEIPLIQRDYAQGRTDPKVTQIRDEFLRRLIGALQPSADARKLDLDLIYGKVVGQRLILLDGQQRLTTLFLLHWYLAHQTPTEWPAARARLGKFTYETRTSSRDFCQALCQENLAITEGSLKDIIIDQPWFFLSWKKDPTIAAMLETLNSIHSSLQGKECAALFQGLQASEECPVFFHFLALAEFGLSEDLYLRLNARGRLLTDFENFKAWLEGHAETMSLQASLDWTEKIDTIWTDFFWSLAGKGNEPSDALFLRFCKGVALNHVLARRTSEEGAPLLKLYGQVYISTEDYKRYGLFSADCLSELFALLRRLEGTGWPDLQRALSGLRFSPDPPLFERFVAENVTFAERALFFAFTQGLQRVPDGPDSPGFRRWIRVLRNLIEHSTIDRSSLPEVIGGIGTLAELAGGDLLAALASPETSKPSGISGEAWREEAFKARLIGQDQAWELELIRAENHPWFRGQIGFLLGEEQSNPPTIAQFHQRAEKAMRIFADEGLADPGDSLFQRALLTTSDYLFGGGPNYSFGSTREHWVTALRDPDFAKKVFTIVDRVQIDSMDSALEEICRQYTEKDWRSYFIRSPHALKVCGRNRIHWGHEGEYILLLRGSRRSTHDLELRSWCLLEKLQRDAAHFAPFAWEGVESANLERPGIALRGTEFDLEVHYFENPPPAAAGPYKVTLARKSCPPVPPLPAGFTADPPPEGETYSWRSSRSFPDEASTLSGLGLLFLGLRSPDHLSHSLKS